MHRTTIAILLSLLFVGLTLTPTASADPLGVEELYEEVSIFVQEMQDALAGGGGICITPNGYATDALRLPDSSGDTVVFYVPVGVEKADPDDLVFNYQVISVEFDSQDCSNAATQMYAATERFVLAVEQWIQDRATIHPGEPPV